MSTRCPTNPLDQIFLGITNVVIVCAGAVVLYHRVVTSIDPPPYEAMAVAVTSRVDSALQMTVAELSAPTTCAQCATSRPMKRVRAHVADCWVGLGLRRARHSRCRHSHQRGDELVASFGLQRSIHSLRRLLPALALFLHDESGRRYRTPPSRYSMRCSMADRNRRRARGAGVPSIRARPTPEPAAGEVKT
jgi:hypothetical protein